MRTNPRSIACRRCGAAVNEHCKQAAGPNTFYRPGKLERSHSRQQAASLIAASRQASTRRARPGPKHRAGAPSSETLRFRCSEAEAQKIREACAKRARELSDVARELLLAWARTET